MHERVDKLAERLEKLDGIQAPSAPQQSPGMLSRLADTPIATALAVITVILCALTMKSVIFDTPGTNTEGYVSSNPTNVFLDAKHIEPPALRVNSSTEDYIDYTLFLHSNDRDAARDVELSFFDANRAETEIRNGTCLTTGQEPLLLKNCRTQIPYGTKSGDYTLRASLKFNDSGKQSLDSTTFSLTTKPVTKPDTTNLTAPISTMLAQVWDVYEGVIHVDVAKTAENRNRINTSDSFVFELVSAKGKTVKIDTKSCTFGRSKPTQALFKCKAHIPEGIKAGHYTLNLSLFDGVKFNNASTGQFNIPKAQIP